MRLIELISEAPISDYVPLGDFEKPGPFRGPDKKLVPHPANELRARRMFERTPYNFRLFFSNIPGTGKYSEYGAMDQDKIREIFGSQAGRIIQGSENAITIVFVGNAGTDKVPLTPWLMAHRFGHAIQAGRRRVGGSQGWAEVEKHFFDTINYILKKGYGKSSEEHGSGPTKRDLTQEYSALFNAIGTQRSSRTGKIKRPYEFLYELFAQYLLTGGIQLNPLPLQMAYGRKAWGRPTKYRGLSAEYRDEEQRSDITDMLAQDLVSYFDGILADAEGEIFVM